MRKTIISLTLVGLALSGCGGGGDSGGDPELRDYSEFFAPLPAPIYPADNAYNDAKAQLGEMLFWDPILSGNQDVACATCHHPDFGWADGRTTSVGVDGLGLGPDRIGDSQTPIHSPTIANVAFTGLTLESDHNSFVSGGYFWDLRADTLEEQALGPLQNPVEMLGNEIAEAEILDVIVERLKANNEYQLLFTQAFGDDSNDIDSIISADNLAKALATFQRTIVSANSRFDQFLAGNTEIFTTEEIKGLNAFIDNGCTDCHDGPMLSDNEIDEEKVVMKKLGPVRTPTLRNVSQTAPYMQDGSKTTLSDALMEYDDRDDLDVGDSNLSAIKAFLMTLDGETSNNIPESVPSGLPVGGNI